MQVLKTIDMLYRSYERFADTETEVLREKYKEYDKTSFHECKLEIPYGTKQGVYLRYKRYFMANETLSVNGLGGTLFMDSAINYYDNPEDIHADSTTLICYDPNNVILEYKRTEVLNPVVRLRVTLLSDKNSDSPVWENSDEFMLDLSQGEDVYFQQSLVYDVPPYDHILDMYEVMKHVHVHCPQLDLFQMNRKFIRQEMGNIIL